MIWVALRNNVLPNGHFYGVGEEFEAADQPSEHWELKPGQQLPVDTAPPALEEMTIQQLKDFAAQHGLTVPAKATKAEIIEMIHG